MGIRERAKRSAARSRRQARGLSEGIPGTFVAALAAFVLVAILYTVATREQKEPRGYAEVSLEPRGCSIEPRQRLNVGRCRRLSPGVYSLEFTKSVVGSVAVATRGTCCPGQITASLETDRSVLVVVERRVRAPIRASIIVP